MSLLISVEEADFAYLKTETGATSGNLSVQLDKLNEAGYIEVKKTFQGKMPRTLCKITPKGIEAFGIYVNNLKTYIHLRTNPD
jgi:DNA-binding PadR family transcriptional regulator